eukprot:1558622-Prymnesium_polylepis.2
MAAARLAADASAPSRSASRRASSACSFIFVTRRPSTDLNAGSASLSPTDRAYSSACSRAGTVCAASSRTRA